MTLGLSPEAYAFRMGFLSATAWLKHGAATDIEIAYAMANWKSGDSPAAAVTRMCERRELDRRGLLRKIDRKASSDDSNSNGGDNGTV